jgi:hypothetical protein
MTTAPPPADEASSLLAWTEGEYGFRYGRAGGIHLFTIGGADSKKHPGKDRLTTVLPGLTKSNWHGAPAALEGAAEGILRDWIARVGGQAPAPAAAAPETGDGTARA